MLKSIQNFFLNLVDIILPLRSDFAIVKNLDEKSIANLPKAPPVEKLDWISPLWNYRDKKVKAIVWELKYKENTRALDFIGKIIFEEIIALMSDIILFDAEAEFVLIPIPISSERRALRGFNQSEYIAKAILEHDIGRKLLYAPQWLLKTKETESQSHTRVREERMKNLSGCFEANPNVASKYIFLIDDVVTTGSTLSEARTKLLSAGAREVFAFTIAH